MTSPTLNFRFLFVLPVIFFVFALPETVGAADGFFQGDERIGVDESAGYSSSEDALGDPGYDLLEKVTCNCSCDDANNQYRKVYATAWGRDLFLDESRAICKRECFSVLYTQLINPDKFSTPYCKLTPNESFGGFAGSFTISYSK